MIVSGLRAEEGTARVILGRTDYDEIVQLARIETTPATRITEGLYWYLLNVLPPLTRPGMRGYAMSEMLTDTPLGNVTIQFYKRRDDECYAKYILVNYPNSWISDLSMSNCLPVDPNDGIGFVE